ncbi:GAF domain-containing protein [Mycolicibacterium sphagni]|uniref:GAF domain-containing protein n=1 Tax=Mycolicibacterium sphagni TaxID=1786 RepID=UPI0013FD6CA6|nr:GAF domain-containing protein [Mycolicibacterium sphagni]MCV7178085.1 GAF domain-containing protein [Mycolicibacterium sphagni]
MSDERRDGVASSTGASASGNRDTARRLLTAAANSDAVVSALIREISGDESTIGSLLAAAINDPDRLAALRRTRLLDSGPSSALDNFAALTAEAVGAPYAAISLVDKDTQTFAGCTVTDGSLPRQFGLEYSVCKFTVAVGNLLVVDDAATHPLLADHPMVRGGVIRAYIGVPLADGRGHAVGTLCCSDNQPHHWTTGQIQILRDLGHVLASRIFDPHANEAG